LEKPLGVTIQSNGGPSGDRRGSIGDHCTVGDTVI
jgi:hypothetical protein